MNGKKV